METAPNSGVAITFAQFPMQQVALTLSLSLVLQKKSNLCRMSQIEIMEPACSDLWYARQHSIVHICALLSGSRKCGLHLCGVPGKEFSSKANRTNYFGSSL